MNLIDPLGTSRWTAVITAHSDSFIFQSIAVLSSKNQTRLQRRSCCEACIALHGSLLLLVQTALASFIIVSTIDQPVHTDCTRDRSRHQNMLEAGPVSALQAELLSHGQPPVITSMVIRLSARQAKSLCSALALTATQ